jgi:hypothetical protein
VRYKDNVPNVDKVEYIFLKTGASKAHAGLQKLRADPENRKHTVGIVDIYAPSFLSRDRV